jgi:hypothetical protein
MGFLISCEAKSITTASVVTETIDTVRWQCSKKADVENACVQGQRIQEGLLPTMPICLQYYFHSQLNLEGKKIAGCNDCQKGETAGIYLETGNAIAVTSCGDNFLIKSLSALLRASPPVAGVKRVCCIQLNMNIPSSFI